MAQEVKIQEIENGVKITETIDGNIVVKLISYQSKPFLRTTNETDEETYQVLDIVGEIYNTPALATYFRIIDKNGAVFIPANGIELIEYSKKIRAFRPDDDGDNFHIGSITTTSNSLTINLADDNVNWAYINGSFYQKYYPDLFNFTPVTTGEKILIIYAKPDAQVFHLAQGAESAEAIEPSYNGLFVARILVNSNGAVVTENNDDNFKTKADDTVYPITIHVQAGIWVYARSNTFEVLDNSSAITPTILGLISDGASATVWGGKRFYIKNSSGTYLTLKKEPTPPIVGDTVYFSFSKDITLKYGQTAVLFLNRFNELEMLNFIGGGSASFPEGAAPGDVLTEGTEGPEWSNRLTNVETNKQDKSMFSALVDKMVHYYDATTQKMLSTGVEWISAGILKVKSIILTTNSGTALPNELGYDGTNVFFGNTKRKLAFKDEIFEHNVRGKRVEATISGTYAIDLNAGNHFSLTATTATTISFSNMILADETCALSMTVTGELLTMPAWLIRDVYSDIPDATKTREYNIIIKKGGVSPSGRFNVINM